MTSSIARALPSALILCLLSMPSSGQDWSSGLGEEAKTSASAEHGRRYERLVIRNVHVIDGNGTPIHGPTDVLVEQDRIVRVGRVGSGVECDAVIDGEGRYLIPGLISMHSHLQDERAGLDMPFQYQLNLWLASGITTVRDLGCDREKGLELRRQSAAGEVIAPRILLYMVAGGGTAEEARESVREISAKGADGIKIFGLDREAMMALLEEAHEKGLRVAHHAGIAETDAWDDIRGGTTTIEHWYGIPDAALPHGSQRFPAGYNYSNELDRFRWAGRLFKEADERKMSRVLQGMVDAGVAWDPTLAIYEAARDAVRAQNQPWFKDYLHPALEAFFKPSLTSHGSFFLGWTTEDEIEWKNNYQLWFRALREFAERGGVICVGEDAGFIYRMHGFGLIRELELHQEAGFHPLDVLRQATGNNAAVLGMGEELGRIKAGYKADLALVNGNPLENLKLLYPTGTDVYEDGELRTGGTIEWTIKDGYCYRGAVLMQEVAEIVSEARKVRAEEVAKQGAASGD
ncbi:MAG: imidazolonepropionase-like amidohydrolase [Planctomycetota bacterium]|jgi:imidazolonepropionase-like amidohydrolase